MPKGTMIYNCLRNSFTLDWTNRIILCCAAQSVLVRVWEAWVLEKSLLVWCLGHEASDVIASALVDMYAKCGCVNYSAKVFRRIQNPSVIPYTSIILGAAKYGLGTLSLQLFQEMVVRRIKPNDITFVGHHYTCIADMLGRVGRIEEAYQLAKSFQVEGDEYAMLWGTLLSASRLYGRVDIALEASNRLIESNQQVAGAYVTLSNAYALAGDWENAHNLRSEMKHTGVCKEPGSSWI
ncbi:Pentatricopeptide repeat-containing protein [Glycine soja]|uniref:Pentatricopeptide repeat-containing protein n=1 Tax=Glycine soja TaxID=3848 RepID=A0A445G1E3_GLYSO|nr:Pentatricopeptide repeat-containing protein [Glycine soja]